MTEALSLDEPTARLRAGHEEGDDRDRLLAAERSSRRSAERAEAELLALLHAAPTGIALFDRDLRYVRVNAALARLNAAPLAAHEGRTLREVVGAAADLVEPALREVLATGLPMPNTEISGPRVDGNGEGHFLVSYYPVSVEGETTGVASIVIDITDRKAAEKRAAALARLSTALSATLDAAAMAEETARALVPEVASSAWLVEARDASVTLLGSMHDAPTGHGREATLAALCEHVLRLERGDADPRGPEGLVVFPMRVHGRVIGALAIVPRAKASLSEEDRRFVEDAARNLAVALDHARLFDAAQRERERAEEASRTKDEFLAVVSHELRTPLNALLGWATMLRSGALDDKTRDKAVEIIERNARTQAQLVDDILDLSRIVTGKLRMRVDRIALTEVVRAAVEAVRPAAEAKGVRLELEPAKDVGPFVGDPDRLQQVVWNLVSNAVKFTGAGGCAHVRMRRDEGEVVLEVEDTGRGIPPGFLPHVFDRFRQADAGTTRRHGGLGLGLAIVRHIVELHGGSVDVRSEGEGHGACFVVRLPDGGAREDPAPRAVSSALPGSSLSSGVKAGADLTGVRAVVVDDEADARDLVASVLRRAGADAIVAESVEEALALVREVKPDVLVTDIAMPGEDGYALVKRLRALPRSQGGRTPAVALTAFTRLEDRTTALLAGFTAHLGKPVEASELVSVLASIARRGSTSRRT